MPLHHIRFEIKPLLEPVLQIYHTWYLFPGRDQLHPHIPVVSIWQALSASDKTSLCTAVPFLWLCPSPSGVRHLCSAGPALAVHHPHPPHPLHCWTCKITQTVSDSNHHLLKRLFGFSVHQSGVFSFPCIILHLLNHSHFVLNSLSCPSGLSLNIILNRFYFLFSPSEVRVSCFNDHNLLFGLRAAECSKGSESPCSQAAIAFICLMTPLGGPFRWIAVFACRKWRWDLPWGTDDCSLRWVCCGVRWWMFQDMDNMEASCVFYVKVGTFTHVEQSKNSLLTVNTAGVVRLTVQHHLIAHVSILLYPRDSLR